MIKSIQEKVEYAKSYQLLSVVATITNAADESSAAFAYSNILFH